MPSLVWMPCASKPKTVGWNWLSCEFEHAAAVAAVHAEIEAGPDRTRAGHVGEQAERAAARRGDHRRAELVVEAAAQRVHAHGSRRDRAGSGGAEQRIVQRRQHVGGAAVLRVEIFGLEGQVAAERIFEAGAERPAEFHRGARAVDDRRVADGEGVGRPARRARDRRIGETARDVGQEARRNRIAQTQACRALPVEAEARRAGHRVEEAGNDVDVVGRGALAQHADRNVGLDADDHAVGHLPVVAGLRADEEVAERQFRRQRLEFRRGDAGRREEGAGRPHVAGGRAGIQADVEAGPGQQRRIDKHGRLARGQIGRRSGAGEKKSRQGDARRENGLGHDCNPR
ncbi:MAG: hypothetical protein V9G24_13045 [Rhodoblastus sp.]